MSSMQGEASEAEQPTSEIERDTNKTDLWTKISTATYVIFVCWMMYQSVSNEQQFKLRLLYMGRRFLSGAALICGTGALLLENQYNDYLAMLH